MTESGGINTSKSLMARNIEFSRESLEKSLIKSANPA